MSAAEKRRWPWAEAYRIAGELLAEFTAAGAAHRIEVAGSVRRHKPMVGDIELLYIPIVRDEQDPYSLLPHLVGGAESNVAIASAAQRKGRKWNPYGSGFSHADGRRLVIASERDVFDFVGLPYLDPCDRR